jgi:hypothetical protein
MGPGSAARHFMPRRARDTKREDYAPANFSSLMASKSCTPPPTRLVV